MTAQQPSAHTPHAGKRVAVIGAGSMGLAAAYQLALDGHAPVVFEADDRIGGMAATFDLSGIPVERYYHFHCISDAAYLEVLEELGLQDRMRWVETKMGYWLDGRVQAWGNPVALLKFKGLGIIAKFRYGLHAFVSTRRDDWRPLDHVEATGWMKRWIGSEAYEKLWRRLFDLKFYEYAHNLSAAWIWTRIRRIGRSRYSLMRERLGYLEGGSQVVLEARRASIESRGGEVRRDAPVSRVMIEGGRVVGIEAGGEVEPFDAVICTVPAPLVPGLVPDLPADVRARFEALVNIPVVCVVAKLAKPVTEYFWLNTSDPRMDIPGIVEYTNLNPLPSSVVYVPYYVPQSHPTYAQSDEVFASKVREYLQTINPSLADEDFLDIRVSRYRYAQPICTPGYLEGLAPAKLPIEGLWAADTSYYYPEDRGMSESIGLGRTLAREAGT